MQRLVVAVPAGDLPASALSPSLPVWATRDESPAARQVKHQRHTIATLESAPNINHHLMSNDGLRRGARQWWSDTDDVARNGPRRPHNPG